MKYNIGNPYQSQQIAVNTPQLNYGSQFAKQVASGVAGTVGSAVGGPFGAIAAQAGINVLSNSFEYGLNAYQAKKNRAYQTAMSNSSYQRAVADLKAAGLSPELMYGNASGASTPSGAQASMRSNPTNLSELLLFRAQLESIQAQTARTQAETKSIDIDNDNKQEVINAELRLKDMQVKMSASQIELYNAQKSKIDSDISLNEAEKSRINVLVANLLLEGQLTQKNIEYYEFNNAKQFVVGSTTSVDGSQFGQRGSASLGIGTKVHLAGSVDSSESQSYTLQKNDVIMVVPERKDGKLSWQSYVIAADSGKTMKIEISYKSDQSPVQKDRTGSHGYVTPRGYRKR